ncbi:MAG TPA: metal-dependent hydrolase [Bryobacteraceae bacterium]|nr:metal-dependent hydrolase [Bryobacteraceae bacterium]
MASAITHFIVGASLALPALGSKSLRGVLPPWLIPVSAGLIAVAPDLDTYAMRILDIPRHSLFAHRGVFHSPFFLMLFCAVLAALTVGLRSPRAVWWLAVVWSTSAITHPLLDAMTDGGSGVMLLFPLTTQRYFFPWRPIHVSPLGVWRFFDRAGPILRSELPFCLAAAVIGAAGLWVRRQGHQ